MPKFSAPAFDTETPIVVNGLHLAYGKHVVLNGVDMRVTRGEVLGLIGRNGAGKSTLLCCLLGLLQPQQGEAFVFGAPSLQMDDARKARLGYVPQQPQAFQWLKVGQLFDYLGQLYPRWDAAHADALLKRWDIDRTRPIAKLSPGQAQRLALARALAPRPDLLVLDEPASALDPVARRELLREIVAQAGEEGVTVLFSSHIVSDLERVASRVAFLHEGRLLLDHPLDDVKDNLVRLHIPAPATARLATKLDGELSRRTLPDGSLMILLPRTSRDWQPLQGIDGLRIDHLGLEDLFIEVAE
jgi:ABC-2 type transport system ATP-binding protein